MGRPAGPSPTAGSPTVCAAWPRASPSADSRRATSWRSTAPPTRPEHALALLGAAPIGGVTTTANPLYTADELAKQLADSGARLLVTVPPFLDRAREAAEKTGIEEIFVFGSAEGARPFAELL